MRTSKVTAHPVVRTPHATLWTKTHGRGQRKVVRRHVRRNVKGHRREMSARRNAASEIANSIVRIVGVRVRRIGKVHSLPTVTGHWTVTREAVVAKLRTGKHWSGRHPHSTVVFPKRMIVLAATAIVSHVHRVLGHWIVVSHTVLLAMVVVVAVVIVAVEAILILRQLVSGLLKEDRERRCRSTDCSIGQVVLFLPQLEIMRTDRHVASVRRGGGARSILGRLELELSAVFIIPIGEISKRRCITSYTPR